MNKYIKLFILIIISVFSINVFAYTDTAIVDFDGTHKIIIDDEADLFNTQEEYAIKTVARTTSKYGNVVILMIQQKI